MKIFTKYKSITNISITIFILFLISFSCHERDITNPIDDRYDLKKPELLGAWIDGNNKVNLSWSNEDGNPQYFDIYKKYGDNDFLMIDSLKGDQYSYQYTETDTHIFSYVIKTNWFKRYSDFSNKLEVLTKNYFMRYYNIDDAKGIDILETDEGAYIILIGIMTKVSSTDHWANPAHFIIIRKTDKYGNTMWNTKIEGNSMSNIIKYLDESYLLIVDNTLIKIDDEGNILLTKELEKRNYTKIRKYNNEIFYIYSLVNNTIWITKIDEMGNTIWDKSFLSESIVSDGDGDIVISSNEEIYFGGTIDWADDKIFKLLKIDATGEILLKKNISGRILPPYHNDTYCKSIKMIDKEIVLLLTIVNSYDTYSSDGGKIYLSKLDENEKTQWIQKALNNEGYGVDFCKTQDNGFIIIVNFKEYNFLLIKMNDLGQFQWYKESIARSAKSIIKYLDNGVIVIGHSNDKAFLLRVDPNGDF
ncbi:MAG: hypothetical protein U9N76_08665 [Candidatus Marinimicrobia bacterium]|nr:hypothetical protein [Candidatus Neomarinimicrobiota bacterium]